MFFHRTLRCLLRKKLSQVILFWCNKKSKCKVANDMESNVLNVFLWMRGIMVWSTSLLSQDQVVLIYSIKPISSSIFQVLVPSFYNLKTGSNNCNIFVLRSNTAHFKLIFETSNILLPCLDKTEFSILWGWQRIDITIKKKLSSKWPKLLNDNNWIFLHVHLTNCCTFHFSSVLQYFSVKNIKIELFLTL